MLSAIACWLGLKCIYPFPLFISLSRPITTRPPSTSSPSATFYSIVHKGAYLMWKRNVNQETRYILMDCQRLRMCMNSGCGGGR